MYTAGPRAGGTAGQGLRTSGRRSGRVRRQHATVRELVGEGMSLRGIARELQVSRPTVRRPVRAATANEFLVGKWAGLTGILDDHKPYPHQRWKRAAPMPLVSSTNCENAATRAASPWSAATSGSCAKPSRIPARPAMDPWSRLSPPV
ncbi:helix-turn-helix domain-containing protein [Streptomyces sp. TRM 70361]|uniref:helix-turn-helix domain-containing protein n=1 Tax=Streptomyces sp. TRM 70361 TaxID=3116553 RepID=UPI003FCCDFCC